MKAPKRENDDGDRQEDARPARLDRRGWGLAGAIAFAASAIVVVRDFLRRSGHD